MLVGASVVEQKNMKRCVSSCQLTEQTSSQKWTRKHWYLKFGKYSRKNYISTGTESSRAHVSCNILSKLDIDEWWLIDCKVVNESATWYLYDDDERWTQVTLVQRYSY